MSEARRAYLDHNATSPLRAEARAAMLELLDAPGNPSSVHADGRAARARVERAREQVAALCGAPRAGVVFTSGATEANALVLHPQLEVAGRPVSCDVLLTNGAEHLSVLRGHRFAPEQVEVLPVDGQGYLDLNALEASLVRHGAAGRRALVSLMAANNETGILQPVIEVANLAAAHGAVIHCDAVQAAGRVALDAEALPVDFLTLSAHKVGGPQGAGALVARHADSRVRAPLIPGGGQERGRRGGTENVAAIAGFGAAAAAAATGREEEAIRLSGLRDRLEKGIVRFIQDARIVGEGAQRLPNTSCVIFAGLKAETLVIALDLAHVSVSAGSACSSGKVGASHVLTAMGMEPDAAGAAIRFSLGWSSTADDVDLALASLERVVPHVRSRAARAA
ncbi:cysteine desulfurase family protein [Aquabacter cavernae]|uniref:cysteine desulfurase family protein n=1 Tax=Aquabacter cavernae TaxID=2496029 RepID=UPI000F8C68ED|nr:cysteine desulfurase family protein [Aquabacter cavernae]